MKGLGYVLSGSPLHPAVMFLHGFLGSSRDWEPVIAELNGEYQCIAVDLPGHGTSLDLEEEAYSMDGASLRLLDVLDRLSIRRCAIVGYSMGGRLALFTVVQYPQRCSRLVLESASPGLPSETERVARREVDELWARSLESQPIDTFLKSWYGQPLFAPLIKDRELLEELLESRRNNDPRELARVLRGMGTGRQSSLWERVVEVEIPVLLAVGAHDGKYVEVAEKIAVLSDYIRVTIVPNCGHNVHLEHTEAFTDLLRDFLKLII